MKTIASAGIRHIIAIVVLPFHRQGAGIPFTTRRCSMVADTGDAPAVKTAVAPLLSVRNGARALDFYKAAFGAGEVFRVDAPSGAVVATLSIAGAEFWVADESPEHQNFSPESLGGGSVRMILTVLDPDAMFERAVAAGARVITPVKNDYGWRLGRVVDPFGHHWEIGRPLP